MGLVEFSRIWLELTLAYFYTPLNTLIMIILLKMFTKIKIIRACLLALLVNGCAVILYAMFISISGFETILSLRLNSFFISYIGILWLFNTVVQSLLIILFNLHKRMQVHYLRKLFFIALISNLGALVGMIAFIKYGIIR